MNQPRDPDAIIATWLDDGPVDLPDETRRAISVGLRTQPRARRMAILGGSSVNPLSRFATAAVILLAVGALSAFVLSNRGGGPGGTPSPSASAAPSIAASPSSSPSIAPSPTATPISTAGWVTFSSTRYGNQIAHPPTWRATSATRDWVFATDANDFLTTAADQFVDPAASYQILLTTFAVDVPKGTSDDQWLTAYFNKSDAGNVPCGVTIDTLVPTTVDGRPGRVRNSPSCSDSQAFVFIGNRVHVFGVWRSDQEPLLRAFLSTVTFQSSSPSGSPGASPSPS